MKTLDIFAAPVLLLTKRKDAAVGKMAAEAFLFVSKRLQRMAFAVLCLMVAQFVLASCEAEPLPMAARISTTLGG